MAVTSQELRDALTAFRGGARKGLLETGRYRLRYFTWGTGPPLVFIHGMADAAEAFVMVMHRLVDRFTCIGYELPDGQTDGSRLARYAPSSYTADMLTLLNHLKLPRVAVLGSSFGSIIALDALGANPDRFSHGIVQNGFACRPLNPLQRMLARIARFWPGWFADWQEIHAFIMRRIERDALGDAPPEIVAFFHKHGAHTPIAAACNRALAIDRADLRSLLPTIRVPILLISGDRDRLVPRSCSEALAAGLPNARQVEFPGCGHYPQYTQPALMAEAIATFLRR